MQHEFVVDQDLGLLTTDLKTKALLWRGREIFASHTDEAVTELKLDLVHALSVDDKNLIRKTLFKHIRQPKRTQHANRIIFQLADNDAVLRVGWRQKVEARPPRQSYLLDNANTPTTNMEEMTAVIKDHITEVFTPVTNDHALVHQTMLDLTTNLRQQLADGCIDEWTSPHGTLFNIVLKSTIELDIHQ